MSNVYFDWPAKVSGDRFVRFTTVRADDVNAAFDEVSAGFEKLPAANDLWGGMQNFAVATGPVNVWAVSIAPTRLTAYVDGLTIRVRFPAANTTTVPTINLNGLGAKVICRDSSSNLSANDIAAGMVGLLTYSATFGKFQLTATSANYDNFDERYLGAKPVDPVVSNNGGPLADGMAYWNTTSPPTPSSGLRVYGNGQWNDLMPATASDLVSYDGGSTQDVLDSAKPMGSYVALRAYTGRATSVRITARGIGGFFLRDDADVASADDGGTVIVDASGRRWKRVFDGPVSIKWFGAKGDGVTDDTAAIQAALNAARTEAAPFAIQTKYRGIDLHAPMGRYRMTAGVTGVAGTSISGDGYEATIFLHEGAAGDVFSFTGVDNGSVDFVCLEGFAVAQKQGAAHAAGYAIKIDGNSFGTTPRVRDVYTYGTYSGLYLDWCFPSTIEGVHCFAHASTGFTTRFNCTSITFQNCYAGANGGSGFKLSGHYSSCVNCASDSNALDGYEIYYDGGAATGTSLISCGSELCARSGISEDRAIGVTIASPRMIMAAASTAAFKFDGGDGITVLSPVVSAVAANANSAFNISNASGAYPSNVAISGWSGNATTFASDIDQPDYVFWPGNRVAMGMHNGTLRMGGIGGFNRNLQTFYIGSNFPAGSGGTMYSGNFTPVLTTSAAGVVAVNRYKAVVNAPAGTVARLIAGALVEAPTLTAGTVTRYEGQRIADMPAGTSADANQVLGDGTVPAGQWSLCNLSTKKNLYAGPIQWSSSSGPMDLFGAGSPEGVVSAAVGSTYRRTDGGAGTCFYVKESGAGNTGWVAK